MNQGPVIICGGAQMVTTDLAALQQHYHQMERPYIIGVDRGALILANLDIPIDLAIGDFDSVNDDEYVALSKYTQCILRYPSNKDDTDMELALEYVAENKMNPEVSIFGAIGSNIGRLDHLLANVWLYMQPRYEAMIEHLYFYESRHYLRCLTPGVHQIYPMNNFSYLSLISLTPIDNLSIQGARYNLESQSYKYPRALISNEFLNEESPIDIQFTDGKLLVLYVEQDA